MIIPGSGAAVEGTGRPSDPYVISLDGGGGGGGFDAGDLKWSARSSAPAGWLVCDGGAVSRTTYAALFTAIGTLYGPGDGTSTFNLPDFTGRFILGADGSHAHGTGGGAASTVLGVTQMPAHAHSNNHDHPSVSTGSAGTHDHNIVHNDVDGPSGSVARSGAFTGSTDDGALVEAAGAHTHTVDVPAYSGSTGPTGGTGTGTAAVPTMPPYTTALPLIKT